MKTTLRGLVTFLALTTAATAQYCTVGRIANTCPGGEFISQISEYDNFGFSNDWFGVCEAGGYEDVAGFGIFIGAGEPRHVQVVVDNVHPSDKVTLWLDSDFDGSFGPSESFTTIKSGNVFNGYPTVPSCTPLTGVTKLRVALSRIAVGPQPACGLHPFGDWKDVTATIATIPGSSPNCAVPAMIGTTAGFGSTPNSTTMTPCGGVPDDIWFAFTPAATGGYLFAGGSPQDEIVGLFTLSGSTLITHVCGFSAPSVPASLTAGQTYYIGVGNSWNSTFGYAAIFLTISAIVPPANDECAGAIPLGIGTSPNVSNANATNSSAGSAPCPMLRDLWFSFTPPADDYYSVATTGATTGSPVIAVYDACGGQQFGCGPGKVVLPLSSGHTYMIRLGDNPAAYSGPGPIVAGLVIAVAAPPALAMGVLPGQIGYIVYNGPPNRSYFVALTLNQGAFPFGAFWGIDATWAELTAQFLAGPPFRGFLSAQGTVVQGPFNGVPPGLTFYAVLLTDFDGGNFLATAPTSITTI